MRLDVMWLMKSREMFNLIVDHLLQRCCEERIHSWGEAGGNAFVNTLNDTGGCFILG